MPSETAATPRDAGYVDRLDFDAIIGWAWDPLMPDAPVEVDILDGERLVVRLLANLYRPDLHRLGIGDGRHGFVLRRPGDFFAQSRHRVRILRAADGRELGQAVRWIEREGAGLDAAGAAQLHARVTATIAQAQGGADLALPLAVVAHELGELVNAQAALVADPVEATRRMLATLPGQAGLQGEMAGLVARLHHRYAPLHLPPVEAPAISLIIPVCDDFADARACLRSVLDLAGEASFEVILADDGSTDETLLAGLLLTGGVRVIRQPDGVGLARSCNLAAAEARAPYLLFLSPRMRVAPHWLEALAETFATTPDAGIAGARLLDAEGRLADCGGLLWRLGDAWRWGRGGDPAEPGYCYLREADFVEAGAMMMRARVFEALGGFDGAFSPGHRMAADLALRVREAGLRVVVQPGCTITRLAVHPDRPAHRAPGVELFQQRWGERLARHRYAGEMPALEAERGVRQRALVLVETTPQAARQPVIFAHVIGLLRLGYRVSLLACDAPAASHPAIAALQRLGVECLYPPYVASLEQLLDMLTVPPGLVYLGGAATAARHAALIRARLPGARIVCSVTAPAEPLDTVTMQALVPVDQLIVTSRAEMRAWGDALAGVPAMVVPRVVTPHPLPRAFEQRFGFALIGDFSRQADIDAACSLGHEVMPKLRSRMATLRRQAEAYLIGPHMPAALGALEAADLHVIGFVPVLADMLHRLRCTIAPHHSAGSDHHFVLDSLAHGLPCVMSRPVAEALALPDSLAWLVADDAEMLAGKIIRLHEDAELNARLAEAGLTLIEARHGAEQQCQALSLAVAAHPPVRLGFAEGRAAPPEADAAVPPPGPAWRGEIEYLGPGHIRGWVYNVASPRHPMRLVARFPASSREIRLQPGDPRPYLPPPAAHSGFVLHWNPFEDGFDVEIEVPGAVAPHFDLLRDPHGATLAGAGDQAGPVTVVIPVYGGLDETLCCLRSVRAARNDTALRVLIIDDCSPDAALSRAVAAFAAEAGFLYRRLDVNLGFVGCVNLGMAAFAEDDVVLLNADTEVPDFWLDRLHRAARRHPRIASVTPMSNNASIMSIPAIGGEPRMPQGLALAVLDDLCRDLDDGALCDVPTAHGFCMYITRAALEDVGLFDAVLFGRGYGEENDFSLRARGRGWRNVVTPGLFVRHVGSVSFSTGQAALLERNLALLNERHPGYDQEVAAFIAIDPLRRARARVQVALWRRQAAMTGGFIVVMVVLALPGGTMHHVASLSRALEAGGHHVLWVRGDSHHAISLSDPQGHAVLRYGGRRGEAELLGDLLALAPAFVHVHHLLDLSGGIAGLLLRSGLGVVITAHDYFFGCPRVTLLDAGGGFCEAPAAELCAPCLDAAPHEALHPSLRPLASDGVRWRAHWAPLLARAHQIIAPSGTAASYMGRLFPGLDVCVRPHPPAAPSSPAAPSPVPSSLGPMHRATGDGRRIAVIGAIGPHKGAALLHRLVAHCHLHAPDLCFVIIGHTDRDDQLRRYPNVTITGKYAPDEAQAVIAKAGCATALFLSPWPETYCFTLSEALQAGLLPVALDRGAIGERLRALGQGILLAPDAAVAAIVEALRAAATQRLQPILPPQRIDGAYGALFSEYYTPPPPPVATPLLLGPGHGLLSDLWCERHVELPLYVDVQSGDAPAGLVLRIWNQEPHPAVGVTARLEGAAATRHNLASGAVADIQLELPKGQPGSLWLRCDFDRVQPLGGGDGRLAAATLFGVTLLLKSGARLEYRAVAAPAGGAPSLLRITQNGLTAPSLAPAAAAPKPG